MNIILGVTGSIAAYKSFDLVRELSKLNHHVKVILSKGALKFVKPELYRYLGAEDVYLPTDDFNLDQYQHQSTGQVLHIDLATWCDRLVIAPMSANFMTKICRGEASDLLSSVFLSLGEKPVVLYPAMNTKMLNHPFTIENFDRLKKLKHVFVAPTDSGELVCGDHGNGKLLSVDHILHTFDLFNLSKKNKNVLISTGATIAPLDPIRYLTNGSTGLTGLELSKSFLKLGYDVTVVCGKYSVKELGYLSIFNNFKLIRIITAKEMEEKISTEFKNADLYISSAAINDIEFNTSLIKIKKADLIDQLPIKSSPDVLKKILELKKPHQKIVGFAAETSTDSETFREKYERKKVDLLVGNLVNTDFDGGVAHGFGTNHGQYYFIKEGKVIESKNLTKNDLGTYLEKWFSCSQ